MEVRSDRIVLTQQDVNRIVTSALHDPGWNFVELSREVSDDSSRAVIRAVSMKRPSFMTPEHVIRAILAQIRDGYKVTELIRDNADTFYYENLGGPKHVRLATELTFVFEKGETE